MANETNNLDAVVQRLRDSKKQAGTQELLAGKEAGREWAEEKAEAKELDRLSRFVGGLETDGDVRGLSNGSAWGTGEQLYFALSPEDDGNRDEAASFWEAAFGVGSCDDLTDEHLQGFVEGALEVWDQAKDLL